MTVEAFAAEVVRVAGELGLSSWERLALILAVAVLLVMARIAGRSAWKALDAVEAQPQPLDPERPADWPGAVAVDANGTPVQTGRTPEEIERDGRENGDGGA